MAKMMVMLLFGAASAYQGGGDQAYNTEDEHLSHGGPGGSGGADDSVTGTSPEPSNRWPTASASYQGGGEQTYHTDDEHLGHGAAVGYGSIGMETAAGFVAGIFFGMVITVSLWYVFTSKKSEKKPQPELEMTVGADLEEAVDRKESKNSVISIAASDAPLRASAM